MKKMSPQGKARRDRLSRTIEHSMQVHAMATARGQLSAVRQLEKEIAQLRARLRR
jgi:hypothetical protein